jgi:phage recombination protein Bet
MSTALISLTQKLSARLGMGGDYEELINTLKATAFRGQVSDAQMTALMVVADQYGLNPFTREIYAFPDKNNGIVPIVGVDGWARIINTPAHFDGMEFEQDDKSCTCIIFRKDRTHPIKVTEYLEECRRETPPWKSHPRRMLRHKAMIQCARLAFGYVGIFDQDEAEAIIEAQSSVVIDGNTGEILPKKTEKAKEIPPYSDARLKENLPQWEKLVRAGKDPEAIIRMVSSKAVLSDAQKVRIRSLVVSRDDSQDCDDAPAFVREAEAEEAAL